MSETPQSIVYLRPDTIGDLVIFSAAIGSLMAEWPKARHTIVVRKGYEDLAPLFPSNLNWVVARFNPFSSKPSECKTELAALTRELGALKPDLVVAATINRTWMEPAVAAAFPKARCVALGDHAVDPLYAARLKLELGVDAAQAFDEVVRIEPGVRDWENNHRLAEKLAGKRLGKSLPAVSVPAESKRAARSLLEKHGLPAHGWIALFAGGLANVPLKSWPQERFAELIQKIRKDSDLPVMLMGHASEAAFLEGIAKAATHGRSKKPAIWLGQDGELPLLAALLADARAYVGHDTGAMHLAAATGRPVVGIFGGGHWPRFQPAAATGVSVVQPLPCFGCNWDCHFESAPCVKLIPVENVATAVHKLLAAGTAALEEVVETRVLTDQAVALIAAVAPRYRALQADRIDRQHRIEELKSETDTKDVEITSLKGEANTKDVEITSLKRESNTKDAEIADLKRETDSKDVEIADIKRAAEERKTEMEAIKAELEAECAEKDTEIAELKAEANTKDDEIDALKKVCNEREALIMTQDGHIKSFQSTVKELNASIAKADKILKTLPPDAAIWAEMVSTKDVHIRNIEARAADFERALDNHAKGYANLEVAKHYGRLLAEKEAAIQTLHQACVAREELIQKLAAESTRPTGALHKLWLAGRMHVREKWIRSFSAWCFKKVVDDYWMKIGVLQHYAPRPLKWDRFPTPRLPVEKLPQVAVVTPSYQQAAFIGSTVLSVLNQQYPRLLYVVQDGGSTDRTPEILAPYREKLTRLESAPDKGQADAVRRGFAHIHQKLGPDDLMCWLNSDDFIAPRALRYVAEYLASHPDVDCIYGHRIIIDTEDREVGRWIMPPHDPKSLEWIDYVPQETMFWRRRAWDLVGGIDTSYQFALDWDLLARFTQARLKIVRLPYFLGCFRVHAAQKTSAAIHTTGAEEMARVRSRFHGAEKQGDTEIINRWARQIRFKGALHARLHAAGIRW